MNTRSIERMIADIASAEEQDQRQVCDWLIANVIMKKRALNKQEAMQWRSEQSVIKQRVFWSVQARTITAENQDLNTHLLEALEQSMAGADAMVQERMNWCAAQIGIADAGLRGRCIQLGERLALYKDYPCLQRLHLPLSPNMDRECCWQASDGRCKERLTYRRDSGSQCPAHSAAYRSGQCPQNRRTVSS